MAYWAGGQQERASRTHGPAWNNQKQRRMSKKRGWILMKKPLELPNRLQTARFEEYPIDESRRPRIRTPSRSGVDWAQPGSILVVTAEPFASQYDAKRETIRSDRSLTLLRVIPYHPAPQSR